MPKIKTHSGAKKRFKLTKTGKVKRAQVAHSQQEDHKAQEKSPQGCYG